MFDEKICNFYANKVHLGVTIIPFITKKIKENSKICTILSENIENEIVKILEKVNIDKNIKKKILEINWNKSKLKNDKELKKYIEEQIKEEESIYIIINGDKQSVNKKSKIVENIKEKYSKKNICIVDCFKIEEEENFAENIVKNHKKILTTSGDKKIKYV